MTEVEARAFVARQRRGVLATIKRDGRPQLSNVVYAVDDDGCLMISSTRRRAKTLNLRRDPRASLAVQGDTWQEYVVAEGTVEVYEGPTLAADLRRYYERVAGQAHPDWQEYDVAMIREGRVLLLLTVQRLYPLTG